MNDENYTVNWNSRTTVRQFYEEMIALGHKPSNVIREIEKRTEASKLDHVLKFLD